MTKHKKRKDRKEEEQTAWQMIKDLILHPFGSRKINENNSLGKFLGFTCIFIAICLLFYITGNNF